MEMVFNQHVTEKGVYSLSVIWKSMHLVVNLLLQTPKKYFNYFDQNL